MKFKKQHKNRRIFLLLCHLIFVTKYRRKVLNNTTDGLVRNWVIENNDKDYKIEEWETDKDHIHFIISYSPNVSIAQIVRDIKQNLTYYIWNSQEKYLSSYYWKERTLWSDGYYVSSIGDVSVQTALNYVKQQKLK